MKKILLGLLLILLCSCNTVINNDTGSNTDYDLSFNEKDLDFSYSSADAKYIELGDEDLYIKSEGTYVLRGEMNNASVIVETSKDEKVKLVLDNVTINSNDFASIYVVESDKVTITLAEGSVNTLSDSSVYEQIDENNVDAVIFSKADLVFNGEGELIINANVKHGIVSKDDLIITGGVYNIDSVSQGINGKDCVKIYDGAININSVGDSIKSSNDEDDYRGFVYVKDGEIAINSGDDAIQAVTLLQVDGGNININESYEGLEGQYIIVNGGNLLIYASDDGINACDKKGDSKQETPNNNMNNNNNNIDDNIGNGFNNNNGIGNNKGFRNIDRANTNRQFNFGSSDAGLIINGGYTYICASGDGVDSNGTIALYDGTLIIDGPTSGGDQAFDFQTGGYAYGSEALCIGNSSMAESMSEESEQFNLLYNLDINYEANTNIVILIGNEILFDHTSAKSFNSILFTSSKIKEGDTVTIIIADDTYTYTFNQITNSNGRAGMNSGGMQNMEDRDFDNREMPEGIPDDFDPNNMPNDFDPNNMPEDFEPNNMEPPGNMQRFDDSQRPQGKMEDFNPNNNQK